MTQRKRFTHDHTNTNKWDTTEFHDNRRERESSSWYLQSKNQRNLEDDNVEEEEEIHKVIDEETGEVTWTRERNPDADPEHISVLITIEMQRFESLLRDLGKDDKQIKKEMERRFGS